MSSFVLDASALLALLNEETGKDLVEEAIGDCSISAVNYLHGISESASKSQGLTGSHKN